MRTEADRQETLCGVIVEIKEWVRQESNSLVFRRQGYSLLPDHLGFAPIRVLGAAGVEPAQVVSQLFYREIISPRTARPQMFDVNG